MRGEEEGEERRRRRAGGDPRKWYQGKIDAEIFVEEIVRCVWGEGE